MNTARRCVVTFVLLAAAAIAAEDACKNIGVDPIRPDSVPGRLIVKPWSDGQFRQFLKDTISQADGERLEINEIGHTGYYTIDSSEADTAEIFSRLFPLGAKFKTMESDRAIYGLQIEPPPPQVLPLEREFAVDEKQMWGLRAINAPAAWSFGKGSATVFAAIVDSGIERTHPDLFRNTWDIEVPFKVNGPHVIADCQQHDFGYDAVNGNCRPVERNQHGTQLAGIIGADGENGGDYLVGVNWTVRLLSVAFLDTTNAGCASQAAKGLEFVRLVKKQGHAPVRVVNLSWGMRDPSDLIKDELTQLAAADVVIVAAAGNEGKNSDENPNCNPKTGSLYPAAYTEISTLISVGATKFGGGIAPFSNCDADTIHIGAPGQRIRTIVPPNSARFSRGGTSLSAAFVTGAIALLASQCKDLNAIDLKDLILEKATRDPALEPHFMGGRVLNLYAAAQACAPPPSEEILVPATDTPSVTLRSFVRLDPHFPGQEDFAASLRLWPAPAQPSWSSQLAGRR